MNDEDFIAQFEQGTLEPFHHADHVHMAFAYLERYPVLEAMDRFCCALKRFAAARGKPQLYHETITWTYMLLVRERMARAGKRQSWPEFSEKNDDLLHWKDNILHRYYRDETLASNLARAVFVFPDAALPDAVQTTH
ncbi:MAG: hypothetical protein WB421_10575 [Terriglobales bacterium]